MLQHPIPIFFLSPPPFLSNFTLQNWNLSSITLIILFINLPLSYSTTRHRHWIYKNICQAKPVKSSIMHIQIIKRYMGQTDLYQKVESLRAISFSTLDNMFKSNSIFNTKLNSVQNSRLACTIQPPAQSPARSQFSQFSPPFFTHLLVHKIILTIPTNTPFI